MATLKIVQISDIHFCLDGDRCVPGTVVDALLATIRSECAGAKNVLFIYSGDLAYSGKPAEFSAAEDLVRRIRTIVMQEQTISDSAEIFVPGNHDCDYERNDRLRERLVNDRASLDTPDPAELEKLLAVQTAYREFIDKIRESSTCPMLACTELSLDTVLEVGDVAVRCLLFNSAWAASQDDRQGTIRLPDSGGAPQATGTPVDLAIAVLHHPFAWFDQDTRNGTLAHLEIAADLCLTGHEHTSDSYHKHRPADTDVINIEAQALWDSDSVPGFGVITVDCETREAHCGTRQYLDNRFVPSRKDAVYSLRRERSSIGLTLQMKESFRRQLEDLGCTISHPSLSQTCLLPIIASPHDPNGPLGGHNGYRHLRHNL